MWQPAKPTLSNDAASGSPSHPSAREQSVTPSCTAGKSSSSPSEDAVPPAPPALGGKHLLNPRSRIETSANSAATKKALARISMATATDLSSERPCIWVRE